MMKRILRMLIALLAVSMLAPAGTAAAQADDDSPHPVIVRGVIAEVTETDAGMTVTIDRGHVDDNPDDDTTVIVGDETHVVPPGTPVEVGARALTVAWPDENETLQALVLVIHRQREAQRRPLKACGEITALPDDLHDGMWTIAVPEVDEYDILATADTRIVPPHHTPEVGDHACFHADETDDGWVARQIQLRAHRGGGDHDRPERLHHLRGTVGEPLPEDRSGTWTLTVELHGGDSVEVEITPDTEVEIEGELVVGAKVAVDARRESDDAGNETLVAVKLKVLEDEGRKDDPPGHDKRARRLEGTVVEVDEDSWTIDLEHHDDDVEVLITEDTDIVGLDEGEDPVGMEVHAVVRPNEDGDLVAKLLKVHG